MVSEKKLKTGDNKEKKLNKDWQLHLLALPTVIYVFIFLYIPMYGAIIAFKNYRPVDGILGSKWVGFEYFIKFFESYSFGSLLTNTIILSLMQIVIAFPIPIILALMLNQVRQERFKKIVQTVTYAPYFISIVVLVGMLNVVLNPSTGVVNIFLDQVGLEKVYFMGKSDLFRWIYTFSGVWQTTGWSAIIYLAALSNVNTELYEAAIVDGANRFHLIRHIDLPELTPMIVMMFILTMGRIMSVDFQKVYLMQNSLNIDTSEIISTYVYKIGLINRQYSYSTAIDLFNSAINVVLLVSANSLCKKLTKSSLW